MYRKGYFRQSGLADFNRSLGLKMNSNNRWIKEAEMDFFVRQKKDKSVDKMNNALIMRIE